MTTDAAQDLIVSRIPVYDTEHILACDGNCEKAWGINTRPQIQLDEHDLDDFAYLSDQELGIAPSNPGTEEGGHRKPRYPVHNKWCFRECERPVSCKVLEFPNLVLPDFQQRQYNQSWKHR